MNNQVGSERCRYGRVEVDVGYEQISRLEIADEFIGLNETQTGVDGTVDDFHGQRLIGRQCLQIGEIGFDEDDAVIAVIAPQFQKMDHIAET